MHGLCETLCRLGHCPKEKTAGSQVRSDTLLDAVLGHVRAAYWKYEGKDSAFVAHLADAQRLLMEAQATASNAGGEGRAVARTSPPSCSVSGSTKGGAK